MDVKEAVQTARDFITDLFEDEQISNVGLEEFVFDDAADEWRITIGFARPWNLQNELRRLGEGRSYKMVCIDDVSGEVTSVKDRLMTPSR